MEYVTVAVIICTIEQLLKVGVVTIVMWHWKDYVVSSLCLYVWVSSLTF